MVFWGLTEALQTAFYRVFCRAVYVYRKGATSIVHISWECPNFCVRSFCDGEFRFWLHREWGVSGMAATVLGRTEQSSPEAAPRRAPLGAGLDGEGARQATMAAAAIPAISQPGPGLFGLGIIASILENAGRTVSRTGSWRWSIRYCAASACRHS